MLYNIGDSDFRVKSVLMLKLLYKIFINKDDIIFCFYNNELNKAKSPYVIKINI